MLRLFEEKRSHSVEIHICRFRESSPGASVFGVLVMHDVFEADRKPADTPATQIGRDELRYRLAQVVEGYTGGCDEDAARAGMDWMRQRDRELGQTPRF